MPTVFLVSHYTDFKIHQISTFKIAINMQRNWKRYSLPSSMISSDDEKVSLRFLLIVIFIRNCELFMVLPVVFFLLAILLRYVTSHFFPVMQKKVYISIRIRVKWFMVCVINILFWLQIKTWSIKWKGQMNCFNESILPNPWVSFWRRSKVSWL